MTASPAHVTAGQRRARLGWHHRLLPNRRVDDSVAIADSLVALHSSDPAAVYLAAAVRMARPSLEPTAEALYGRRSLLRHHAMRRTLWVMSPAVAAEAHATTTTDLLGRELRRWARIIEDQGVATDGAAWLAAAMDEVEGELARRGPVTARELGRALPGLGTRVVLAGGKAYEATQGLHTRVLQLLGFAGRALRAHPVGGWTHSEYRWVAAADWLPGGLGSLEAGLAAAGLARRWLGAFGPATTEDLRWWAGWTLARTRRALADAGAVAVGTDEGPAWVAPDDPLATGEDDPATAGGREPWVALLPALDPTTMGWRQRGWYLDADHVPLLFDGNGNAGPTAWADGRVVGGWVQRPDGEIALGLLADVGGQARRRLDGAARALADLVGPTRFRVRFPAPLQRQLLA